MKSVLMRLLLLLVFCGCGDGGTDPDDSIAGRYELRSANGSNLPYTVVQFGNERVEITAGHLQMNGDGTFTVSLTTRTVQGGTSSSATDTDNGTWTQTGNQFSFRFSDNSVDTGVLSGDQFTIVSNSVSFVFRK